MALAASGHVAYDDLCCFRTFPLAVSPLLWRMRYVLLGFVVVIDYFFSWDLITQFVAQSMLLL
jgi:hypothetical protein